DFGEHVRADPAARDTLIKLRGTAVPGDLAAPRRESVLRGVITNTPTFLARDMLAWTGLIGFIDVTVGPGDGVRSKPDPDIVLREFEHERERSESESAHFARRLVEEQRAAIDSSVARAARDPELLTLARRDLARSRDETLVEWLPHAPRLAQQHGLPLLKILDAEGRILANAHWPAAFNVTDTPGLILACETATGARLVRERDAKGEFLALEAPCWLPPGRR